MSGARVLVVDDEPQIQRVLRPSLTASGYAVLEAGTGREALAAISAGSPDLIILDLGLPDMDGKEVLRKLRVLTRTPVIVLSARDRESEKIAALDLGADDYVEKPFAMGELLARMRTALRHSQDMALESECVAANGLVVNVPKRVVTKNGAPVKLTPKEFELLAFLARHSGRPLTHREILKTVWGPAHQNDSQYLRVFIGQLRAKIEENAATPKIIVTEPGVGYRLIESD
ncbi:response regulator transcription factor [Methylocystis sp. L43]|jgi:two-component system KDP operon response regulator KdpE|uniref:response regulator transcription factor n=1 Tax=unclassified Methylocystis TaxID=2625913 RepID=UPI0018C2AAD2|nr:MULTISPECIES: response regulator transcription factor [unclassified Methylocystis]MBG0798415.1 response regulator transcription factor [Methylocystis sp. L43]MBG0805889.1 response regulator transcription factor [Methylocystis sp. H15]